jgi:hypothetical protein
VAEILNFVRERKCGDIFSVARACPLISVRLLSQPI